MLLVVLLAALAHASWNALVKSGQDKLVEMGAVTAGGAFLALLAIPFLPLPAAPAWPWLFASMVIHLAYLLLVANAYRTGDLTLGYPLMRGLGPVLVALGSTALLGERLSLLAFLGVALVAGGLLLLAGFSIIQARRAQPPRALRQPITFALMNAVAIAGYTVVDGIGVRLSGSAAAYVSWDFVLNAALFLPVLVLIRGKSVAGAITLDWRRALIGGGCSYLAYGLALWAMTVAPVAMVAALRETSIVFATAIGALFLREPVTVQRLLAVAVVSLGGVLLKLG